MLTPLLGKLGDTHGKKRMLVLSLGVFGLGSLGAAAADSLGQIVACRVLQGTGAAVFPLAFGIIRDEFPAERVGVAVGVVSSVFGAGGGIGLVGSGFILEHLSWQWLFLLGAAPVLAACVLIAVFRVWIRVERRVAEPLVDLSTFARRGALGTRHGHALALRIGLAASSSALLLLAFAQADRWLALAWMGLLGVGIAFALAAIGTLVIEHSAASETGVASGVNMIMRTIGAAVGAQVAAAVISAHTAAGSVVPDEAGFTVAFALAAGAAGLALVPAALLGGRRLRLRLALNPA